MQAFCRFFFRLFCKLFVKLQNSRFYRSPARRNPYINSIAAQHLLPCGCFCLDLSLGSPAQSPPDGFARNLLADFPSYCPEIPCQTTAFEAGFCPRTKECRTRIDCSHKVCLRNFYAICRKIRLRILRTSFVRCCPRILSPSAYPGRSRQNPSFSSWMLSFPWQQRSVPPACALHSRSWSDFPVLPSS